MKSTFTFLKLLEMANFGLLMKKVFKRKNFELLRKIGREAKNNNLSAYLVGGPVRDLLLGLYEKGKDLDIVVSGEMVTTKNAAINLAKKIVKSAHFSVKQLKVHQHFGTATIFFPGFGVDFAFARKEKYLHPGVLPEVTPGNIETDLYRRDFTVNSLAIDLSPNRFGELVDPTGGKNDLRRKLLRVLHERSFVDDPTRVLRAARFAGRYDFTLQKKTLFWLKQAIRKKALSTISSQRFREEMVTLLKEENFVSCVSHLAGWSVLNFLSPKIHWTESQARSTRHKVSKGDWLINLFLLIKNLSYQESEEIARRMVLTRKERKIVLTTKKYLPLVLEALERNYPLEYIYCFLNLLPEQGLAYLRIVNPHWANLINTFQERKKKTKPATTGEDLKKLGYPQGPIYKKILNRIFLNKLLGRLPSKSKEIEFVLEQYPLKKGRQ